MDPCSFNLNTARELRLRRHIREVLLPYVRTHLTSDYVAFTERVVEELLLQILEYVPMADPTSFLPPTDPFEVLMLSLQPLDLTPPEEKWTTSSEHLRYIRILFPPSFRPQDLPTEKCWLEDDHHVKLSLICRPISSPILSRRARRETPKFGSISTHPSIPRTKSALTAFIDLHTVSVQCVDDLPTPPVDEVLDLRITLDSATGAWVRPFLQSVPASPMRAKFANSFEYTPNVLQFLGRDSPPRRPPGLDSPPLFPRIAKGPASHESVSDDARSGACNPIRFSDLAAMVQVVSPKLIDGEDGEINDHHMEAVNGWTTLRFSSPLPPSLHSSDGSGVDELWNISPPGTPATSLVAAKMDEVEIPRVRTFGHKNPLVNEITNDNGAATLLTVANSPGFFITSFISAPIPMPQTQKPFTSQLDGLKSGMHSPRPLSPGQSISYSLLGQPSSTAEVQANEEGIEDFGGQKLNDAVASIYSATSQDPFSYIIEERLDEKDILLMDVPNLPPPTTHPRNPSLFPEGMQSFVAPKGEASRLDTASASYELDNSAAFLRPVKGIKPLALDLSWRPFNFGKTIPTDEEVARIAKPIQTDEVLGYRDERYEKTASVLLELDASPISAENAQLTSSILTRGCEDFGTSPTPKRAEEDGYIVYLLTQRERMRVSGANPTLDAEVEVSSDVDTEQGIVPWPYNDDTVFVEEGHLYRREHQGSRDLPDSMECHSRNRTDHVYYFDDSGIDVMDSSLGQFPTGGFGVPHLLLDPLQDDLLNHTDTPATHKANIDYQSENKENIPPGGVDGCYQAECQPDPPATQYDWSTYFEFPESQTPSFEPLSFASQSQLVGPSYDLRNSKAQGILPLTPSVCHVKPTEDRRISTSDGEQIDSRVAKRRKLDDLVPASSKDLFSTFIGLRNQPISGDRALEHSGSRNDTPTPHETLDVPEQMLPRAAPDDVLDQRTVRLPEPWSPAAAVHRYLASVTLIQKRALVCELQSQHCQVVLVERYDLGGADIIVDPDFSVLFVPLLALPAHLEPTVERISCESWHYPNLLVVLEAFPSAQGHRINRSRQSRPVPYAYTPPICKAIKKLRRNLGIAEGCGTMNPRCTVTWAFANDVEEAAKFVRCFGEEACAISNERGRGMLWDGREWLEEEEREGESDLARVHGMNAFAAFVLLYNRSLDSILDMSPEARLADFGQLLGAERVALLNAVVEGRMQQIAKDVVDSVVDSG